MPVYEPSVYTDIARLRKRYVVPCRHRFASPRRDLYARRSCEAGIPDVDFLRLAGLAMPRAMQSVSGIRTPSTCERAPPMACGFCGQLSVQRRNRFRENQRRSTSSRFANLPYRSRREKNEHRVRFGHRPRSVAPFDRKLREHRLGKNDTEKLREEIDARYFTALLLDCSVRLARACVFFQAIAKRTSPIHDEEWKRSRGMETKIPFRGTDSKTSSRFDDRKRTIFVARVYEYAIRFSGELDPRGGPPLFILCFCFPITKLRGTFPRNLHGNSIRRNLPRGESALRSRRFVSREKKIFHLWKYFSPYRGTRKNDSPRFPVGLGYPYADRRISLRIPKKRSRSSFVLRPYK